MPLANPRTCKIDGCDITHHALDLCRVHYNRKRRHGDPHIVKGNGPAPRERTCTLYGCDRPHHAKGFCHPHYEKSRRPEPTTPQYLFGVFGRSECEKCASKPMGGGRWCLTHFHEYIDEQDALDPSRRARRDPIRCGTQRGRERHRRRNEPLCGPCEADAFEWIERMTRAS